MMKRILMLSSMLAMVCQLAMAQSSIRGRVTNENGDGLGDATVRAEGSTSATTADERGYFTIVTKEGTLITISRAGYKRTSAPAANGMVVKMLEDKKTLNEIVVTALQVKKEKKSLGYSTTTISGANLTQGQDRSMLAGIAGKVAGVNITNTSGSPGSGTRVVIRGGSSITGNNQALIVVDGVPIDNSNAQNDGDNLNNQLDAGNRGNDVNPDDIESMTVLKGPAASALYGSRGANGAIIITTKKGKGGAGQKKGANISFSTNVASSSVLMFPEFQNGWGQGYGGQTHTEENWSWGPKFDGLLRPWGNVVDGKQKIKVFSALPDNVRDFYNNGTLWENNIGIGGSTENSNYYISYNNLQSKGIVDNSGYNRNGIRINAGHKLANNIEAQVGLNYTNISGRLFGQGQANNSFFDQIYQTPRDIPLRELRDLTDPFNSLEGYYGAYTINPYYIIQNYKNNNKVNRLSGNLDLTWKPAKWLSILNRTTNDFYIDNTVQYAPRYNVVRPDFGVDIVEPGSYSVANNIYNEINNDIMASTQQDLTTDLDLKALVGFNVRNRTRNNSFTETRGGLVSNDWLNFNNTADSYNGNNFNETRRWMGVYTDLAFGFQDYLYLNLTARNDWSSSLPAGSNSYFYPGANLSFVLTDLLKKREAGWDSKYLSYAKIRLGSARTGNDPSAYLLNNSFNQAYVTDGRNNSELLFPVNGVPAVSLANTKANPNLRPEIIAENEVGAEIGLFNNRLNFDVSYYVRNSRDLIIPVDLGASSGYTATNLNAGKVRNQGIELAVNATPISTKSKFRWDVFGTYTKNKNTVLQLDEDGKLEQLSLGGFAGMSVVAAKGLPYGAFYTRGPERDPNGNIVVDANGMPILATSPKLYGSYNPDWMASLGSDFSYKGFKLHLLFNHKQGGFFYSRLKNIMEFVGTSATTSYNDRQDFVVPNSVVKNADGTFSPNTTKVNAETFWTEQSNNEINILPATFTKLREASLSYQIPSRYLAKTKLGNASVGIYGNNLLLWLPKAKDEFGFRKNITMDPEVNGFGTGNVQGIEFGTTPSLRNYGVNLKLNF
jgi:TonB-linked SusC/RagA family outer membrane protein